MPYLLVSVAYLVVRAALWWAGVPFVFALDWMWLADAADLRDRLAETLWFFHAFPPGMNLLTGVLLKLGGDGAATLASLLFTAIGLGLANGLVALGLAAGLGRVAAPAVATGFLLTPPALYFGHLYLYEWPIVTLLVASAVAFHRACASASTPRWALFFGLCGLIAVTRSTFHLVWFAAMVGLAAWACGRQARRAVLAGALPGLLVVLLVYGKNAVVFGEFAASTFGPAGLHLVTIGRMPQDERTRWIADGRLSAFAAISPYAPPRLYRPLFDAEALPGWPALVNRLDHPSVQAPNFNHWFILEANQVRQHDVEAFLLARPLAYLQNAWVGLLDMLGPSTEWHPRSGTPASPHAPHQRVLGPFTAVYNRVVHGWPFRPVGLYVVLPIVLIAAAWRAWRLFGASTPVARAQGAVLAYALVQVVYVLAVSSLATFLESARYRFQVEPFILVLAAVLVSGVRTHGRLPD